MTYHLIARRSVVNSCQEAQIVATICGLVMLIVALILGARKVYALVEEKTAKEALSRAFPHQDSSTTYPVNEDK